MEKFIVDYPALAVAIFGAFLTGAWALVRFAATSYHKRIEARFKEQRERNFAQDRRIGALAVSAAKVDAIHDTVKRLEAHVEKATETITAVRVEQADFCARLEGVEAKMPNGELKELAEAFTMLAKAMPSPPVPRVRAEQKRPRARSSF